MVYICMIYSPVYTIIILLCAYIYVYIYIGQFMVNAVEVDPVKQMLIQPGREPVPVKLSKNWNTQDNCWLAKNVGKQGEGLIRGSIYDYIVSTIDSTDIPKLT